MADRGILFSANEQRWRSAAGRAKMDPEQFVAILNRGERFCVGCRTIFPRTIEHFRMSRKDIDGLRSQCRSCEKLRENRAYWRDHAKKRAKQLEYQRENRDRLYAYNRQWQSRRHRALRQEAIAAYGSKCTCCGEAEPTFLDLDHINNDGAEHRRELGNTTVIMLDLKRSGWPTGRVQLLCCNCNQGKVRNGGVCPHQEKSRGR